MAHHIRNKHSMGIAKTVEDPKKANFLILLDISEVSMILSDLYIAISSSNYGYGKNTTKI
jgi:hypothetical protein